MEVNQALVDAHLEAVVGVGALTARGLATGDTQSLGRETDRTLDLEALLLGAADQVSADLLQVLDAARGQRDPDAVDLRLLH